DVAEEDENSVLLLSLSEPDNFNNGNEENFNNGIEENLNISSMFNLEPINFGELWIFAGNGNICGIADDCNM
ncbi:8602_t:CDS:2, partial [Entrophospora sp. SA101]